MIEKVLLIGSKSPTGQLLTQILTKDGFKVVGQVDKTQEKDQVTKCGAMNAIVMDITDDRDLHDTELMQQFDAVVCATDCDPQDPRVKDSEYGKQLFDACMKLANTCALAHTKRFIHVGVINATTGDLDEHTLQWMKMSSKCDSHIKSLSNRLLFTVIRSALVNDGQPTGQISCGRTIDQHMLQQHPYITRKDLCDTVCQILKRDHTKDMFIEVTNGDTPIVQELDNLKQKQSKG